MKNFLWIAINLIVIGFVWLFVKDEVIKLSVLISYNLGLIIGYIFGFFEGVFYRAGL